MAEPASTQALTPAEIERRLAAFGGAVAVAQHYERLGGRFAPPGPETDPATAKRKRARAARARRVEEDAAANAARAAKSAEGPALFANGAGLAMVPGAAVAAAPALAVAIAHAVRTEASGGAQGRAGFDAALMADLGVGPAARYEPANPADPWRGESRETTPAAQARRDVEQALVGNPAAALLLQSGALRLDATALDRKAPAPEPRPQPALRPAMPTPFGRA